MVFHGYPVRTAGRMSAVVCAAILLFSCAGCAEEPTPQPTTNSPTAAAPVFASDEEALAAAAEAYANYLRTYDESWADGDGSMEDFLGLSVGNAHQNDRKSHEEWTSKNWRPTGATKFDSMTLQAVSQAESGTWQIQTYVCLDASEGDVVDANGVSVAKPGRPLRLPLEVWFVTTSASPEELKISESNVWSGQNFC
jgi:hypothetical protein